MYLQGFSGPDYADVFGDSDPSAYGIGPGDDVPDVGIPTSFPDEPVGLPGGPTGLPLPDGSATGGWTGVVNSAMRAFTDLGGKYLAVEAVKTSTKTAGQNAATRPTSTPYYYYSTPPRVPGAGYSPFPNIGGGGGGGAAILALGALAAVYFATK